jgi:hypothetical protein
MSTRALSRMRYESNLKDKLVNVSAVIKDVGDWDRDDEHVEIEEDDWLFSC